MSERDTYIPYMRDDLIKRVGFTAASLASKLQTFADEKGAVRVSFSYLAEIWGTDKRQLVKAANLLAALDIWHYTKHRGRGLVTEWKKGANYEPFVTLKKVQILQKKGTKNAPNNKDYKKDRLISAHTRVTNQSKRGLTNAGETPATPEVMEQFEQFWRAFFFGSYAQYEKEQMSYKERAQAVWQYLPAEKRERILREIKAGNRYDKTHFALWYLQHYKQMPPVWFAEDPNLTADMVGQLQVMKYKGRVAYCKPEDVQTFLANGAKLFE